MKYLAVLLLLTSLAFSQKVVFKVKQENGKLRLVPYLPVEVEVKPLPGSSAPVNRQTITCKIKAIKVGEQDGKTYRVTQFEFGDMKFEVVSWVLSSQ